MAKLRSPLTVLRLAFGLFKSEHEQIFYPFLIIVFINLLVLEILYFIPRYPLSLFFHPMISRIWGEQYMHYPFNLVLLPKLFYYAQMAIFFVFTTLLTAMVADMVSRINNEEPVSFKVSFKQAFGGYIYLILYAALSLMLFHLFNDGYGLVIKRALKIHSTAGIYFWLKKFVFYAAPYVQYACGILATALFIYVPVIIVVEKKKIFSAIFNNFKMLFGSFWVTIGIVLVPMLFDLPLLLAREHINYFVKLLSPEAQLLLIFLSVLVVTGINIVIIGGATTYYLYKKESVFLERKQA